MGIGTLGFLKGASKVALDSIDAREEAEREIKKEEARQRLKAKLDKELALATVTEKQYEERDGILWMVGYNSNGGKVENSERPASPYEIEKRTAEKAEAAYNTEKRSLDLQKVKVDIEDTQSQIHSRQVRDSNDTRATNAQVAAYVRSGTSGGGGLDSVDQDDPDAINFDRAKELQYRYAPQIAEAIKSGRMTQASVTQAAISLARNAKTGSEMQELFLNFLNTYNKNRVRK